ncbi:MAG: tRNA lysidine(34) synthetase TilS [Clostridia bacterium]|nr:tRNA lysidine(34) synthetase TilS [Clostridia bacterium]
MERAKKTIVENKMFKKGDTVAVACSGGIDSMCLLHFLHANKKELGINVVAVNIDHQIRENSSNDSDFVANFCKENGITCYKFKVDALALAKEKKLGTEEAARIARYKIFDSLIKKNLADKIAIAHHQSDQAETILLNIFRGTGLKGASGMETMQGNYVRPLLNTSKVEIENYAKDNNLEHVEDQTNKDDTYSRNFIRNQVLPLIKTKWKNIEKNLINFANVCKQDDEYILSTISFDDILIEKNSVRIPLYKFVANDAVQNRLLRYAFAKLGLSKDIEKRHLKIIRDLVATGENGSKINLPNNLKASLDYDELMLYVPKQKKEFVPKDFKTGKTVFENFVVNIKKTNKFDLQAENTHIIDANKLPSDVKWRVRQTGDVFAKFGSGEKKLKDYFIDKKIPNLQRDQIPLLASGNEIYCVLCYEISDKVKTTKDTKKVYVIDYKKTNKF